MVKKDKNKKYYPRFISDITSFLIPNVFATFTLAQYEIDDKTTSSIDRLAKLIESKIIEIRRDIHQYPELGNCEFRTSSKIKNHLEELGIKTQTEIAHTGVVGILKGKYEKPVVALRADMDALPITEELDLPFFSKVRSTFNGKECGVMHACGHDVHTAILMGVAEILAKMRTKLPGTVKFIFQPAEEGPPQGEDGGASLMIREGVLENPRPDAIFALHTYPEYVGKLLYKSNAILASSDGLEIIIRGRGTHGAAPWYGIDPIVVASQIVLGLQSIVSRQIDLTKNAAVISVGSIIGGNRGNIIPAEVKMSGTIRTLNEEVQEMIHKKIKLTAEKIAESAGASAEVIITKGIPVTINDEKLTHNITPILSSVVGNSNLIEMSPTTGTEDFSYFSKEISGFYFFLGVVPTETPKDRFEACHSPKFYVDEKSIMIGMRSLAYLTFSYLNSNIE